jgi:hypothetical protein
MPRNPKPAPQPYENPVKKFTITLDGQQLNVINEALRQFEARNPGVLRNAGDNLRYLPETVSETIKDAAWKQGKQYNWTI